MALSRIALAAATRASTPSCLRIDSTPGCSVSQGRCLGNSHFSNNVTRSPVAAAQMAATDPAGSPPTITTSAAKLMDRPMCAVGCALQDDGWVSEQKHNLVDVDQPLIE